MSGCNLDTWWVVDVNHDTWNVVSSEAQRFGSRIRGRGVCVCVVGGNGRGEVCDCSGVAIIHQGLFVHRDKARKSAMDKSRRHAVTRASHTGSSGSDLKICFEPAMTSRYFPQSRSAEFHCLVLHSIIVPGKPYVVSRFFLMLTVHKWMTSRSFLLLVSAGRKPGHELELDRGQQSGVRAMTTTIRAPCQANCHCPTRSPHRLLLFLSFCFASWNRLKDVRYMDVSWNRLTDVRYMDVFWILEEANRC
ncbi:hypothetical protein RRG08_019865 [Elysia crispata]|uniref:Uncharacterized protein n=1 Tax=Elysia crispata TaxID=231223 RepID=A0AAE1AEN3_9GAST|nr:hypothetical protein RRG08_019865 [Elysia crispata]